MRKEAEPLLVGLDVNATRVRGVGGATEGARQALSWDGTHAELPLAVSLEGKRPEVGRAGAGLCRRLPHLACLDFLAALGGPRAWAAGRHRLDAARALSLVWERVQPACARAKGVGLALPAYLNDEQIDLLATLAGKAKLPVLGSVPSPLAAALAAYADRPWAGPALVAEADDHALTWAAVLAERGDMRLLAAQHLPALRAPAWKERLLHAAADRCIRQSRRDPRDSAPAEQAVYDQLDGALEACAQRQIAELKVQTPHWYQNVLFHCEEVVGLCAPLVRRALAGMRAVLAAAQPYGPPSAVLVTAAAGRLPGLALAVQEGLAAPPDSAAAPPPEDFGESLLEEETISLEEEGLAPQAVVVLPADAAARAAHALALRWRRGELPRGHLDAASLLPPQPVDAGPPRLQFQGQDYLLGGPVFTLGRHPGCDLAFDGTLYPAVSARHCEITFEQWAYVVRDLSRHGTFVNNRPVIQETPLRPGDWLRLGANGPLLRFLGQAADRRKLVTTA